MRDVAVITFLHRETSAQTFMELFSIFKIFRPLLLLHSTLKLALHYLTDPVIIIMYTKGLRFIIEWLTHVICNVGVVHILKKVPKHL